jgi:hypothetical protein
MPDPAAADLDAMCREALTTWRSRAFDNVDVERLMAGPIDVERARWIGRHLLLNGRALDAYRTGQAILARAAEREDSRHDA